MSNLVSTFWNRGGWKEAEVLEVYVETHERVLGAEHLDTLFTSMNGPAFTHGACCIGEKCPAERTRLRIGS